MLCHFPVRALEVAIHDSAALGSLRCNMPCSEADVCMELSALSKSKTLSNSILLGRSRLRSPRRGSSATHGDNLNASIPLFHIHSY